MYPFRRQILEYVRGRRLGPLAIDGEHVNAMRAWPWDIDPFGDLNNGRILTLSDVGRIVFADRIGLIAAMRRRRWGLAMAGSAPQYRKRVTMWTPIEFRTRLIGRDDRFFYMRHLLMARGEPAAEIVCRLVVTEKRRMIPTDAVTEEMGVSDWRPALPDWVAGVAAAEALRPWPPADAA